jgi:hypothetical protein
MESLLLDETKKRKENPEDNIFLQSSQLPSLSNSDPPSYLLIEPFFGGSHKQVV